MIERYKTIYSGGEAETLEKKSRFIANVRLAESEEEALAFIEEMKKKYWDASHNCFAYTVGERQEIVRAGDDGEPGGTAGRPMLDVLLGEGLCNTALVVTRYFGGTLLGTGGLVRAYSAAAREGIKSSTTIEKQYGTLLEIQTDYNGIGKIQYILGKHKIPITDSQYTDVAAITILAPISQIQSLKAEITEATNGRAVMSEKENRYFAILKGRILTGDALRP